MHEEHKVFEKPHDRGCRLWRYMDFAKFVSLLHRQSLWFSNLALLADRFEGTYPKSALKQFRITSEEEHEGVAAFYRKRADWTKHMLMVNCWHIGKYETLGFWNQYAGSGYGVAVRSTCERLERSFHAAKMPVYVGQVKYIDYQTDSMPLGNVFYTCTHKRKEFAHECELRAVVQEANSEKEQGVYAPVDIDRLVEEVRVSPGSPDWFREVVQAVSRKYGLDKRVLKSSLDDEPL